MVKQLLFADSIPGPVGRPLCTWMAGAMQDLNTLGPYYYSYSWTSSKTGRSWHMTRICGGGSPAGANYRPMSALEVVAV